MAGYISEFDVHGGSGEFIEVALPRGTDASVYQIYIYLADGSIKQQLSLGPTSGPSGGKDVYVVDANDGLGDMGSDDAIALVDGTGTVLQFISYQGNTITATAGPANGMTSTNVGNYAANASLETSDGGATYYQQNTQTAGTIACYGPGSLIETPGGPREVSALRPGDLVLTADHGAQEVRWTGRFRQALNGLPASQRPVLLRAGCLGPGLPARDLIVSPQHRILAGGAGQLAAHFPAETLVPAKALVRLPGIRFMQGRRAITWAHFACARHELVTVNGCLTETLLPGPVALGAMGRPVRARLQSVLQAAPGRGSDASLAARPLMTPGQARAALGGAPR